MSTKLVVGNLKMNLISPAERESYLQSFQKEFASKKIDNTEVVICPAAVHLEQFAKELKMKAVSVGAQNAFWEEKGSFTGEISPLMAKNAGVSHVIVGHSERRKYFAESDEIVNVKIKAVLKSGLKPVLCIGETLEQRNDGSMAEVLTMQIKKGLDGVSALDVQKAVVAYEPVWAIGSDKTPTSDELLQVKILIRKTLADIYGLENAEKVKILYGGSVKADLVKDVCLEPELDGVLVGRESLNPNEFLKIVEIIDKK
ncbi:MAG TPA: triose-phosphate isomerase [Patescibacteria group bacterium]